MKHLKEFKNFDIKDTDASDNSLYEMSNYSSKKTGLPMIIWVSNKGKAKHGPRIKVQRDYNTKTNPDNMFTISVSDDPEIKAGTQGEISNKDLELIYNWIKKNKNSLIKYWKYEVTTDEFEDEIFKS